MRKLIFTLALISVPVLLSACASPEPPGRGLEKVVIFMESQKKASP